MDQTIEIMINQLVDDEEFRLAFSRMPRRTVRESADWGVPLCDSEILALVAADSRVLERLADELTARLNRLTH